MRDENTQDENTQDENTQDENTQDENTKNKHTRVLTDVERGLLAGLLIGEGHFGGDGRYPQITLRMHTRHEALFHWLVQLFPRSKLYGPYHHGGRHYFQWMARGPALAEDVLPAVETVLSEDIDAHVFARVQAMRAKYAAFFASYDRDGG
jgi:hypothetical protein